MPAGPIRLEDGTRLKGGPWNLCRGRGHGTSAGSVPFGGAVFQTGYPSPHPPALKGGVTANAAFQAGSVFQR